MKCPECGEGHIRVAVGVVCLCGHHPLVCDSCLNNFFVDCGPPERKLPPEFPMRCRPEMLRFLKEQFSGGEIDLFRENIKKVCPLLEDYKQ
jgi:transposase-like protein